MKTVDDFFQKGINRTLYHYTSIDALFGIAESRSIWASHIYCLNDSKEIIHASQAFKSVIDSMLSELEKEEKDFLEHFKKMLDFSNQTFPFIFIFSLSEEKSLLSQWRSYTPHGKGVSLGFDANILNALLQENAGFRIAKCVYDPDQKTELLSGLIDKILDSYRQEMPFMMDPSIESRRQTFFEKFRSDILQTLAIVKHPAFAEESEWRIISPYFPFYKDEPIQFREGGAIVLPYIEIKLPEIKLEEVILGPTPHEALSMHTLSAFLSNKRLCDRVMNPSIPYRKWK